MSIRGVIFDVVRFATHDGRGIRTTIFFKGCPLDCWWCHNPEGQARVPERAFRENRCLRCGECVDACVESAISMTYGGPLLVDPAVCRLDGACVDACPTGATEILGRTASVEELLEELERDAVFHEESGGGATFSGGEPLLQPGLLLPLLDACRERGIHTTVDTCGHAPSEILDAAAARADAFLYDVKHVDDERHRHFTGVSNRLILDNLHRVTWRRRETGAPELTVRVPVIAGVNDDDEAVGRLAAFLAALDPAPPVDLLPCHTLGAAKYARLGRACRLPDARPPDAERLDSICRILADAGLHVTIRGEHRGHD